MVFDRVTSSGAEFPQFRWTVTRHVSVCRSYTDTVTLLTFVFRGCSSPHTIHGYLLLHFQRPGKSRVHFRVRLFQDTRGKGRTVTDVMPCSEAFTVMMPPSILW